jgi:hypothetical protein
MGAPPGASPVASAHRFQCGSESGTVVVSSFGALMNAALAAPELAHLGIRSLTRAVKAFVKAGLFERDLVAWVLGYADPTGETAVRNVMRQAARA